MHFSVSSLQGSGELSFANAAWDPVDLEGVDPYSLETLKDLLNSRINQGLDFYISSFKEDAHCYSFEASRFIEQIFRKNSLNPLTRNAISSFDILRYSEKSKCFEFYCNYEQIKKPVFYIPVFISDHTRTQDEKQRCLHKLGCFYLREENYDLDKALYYLTQSAEKGFYKSQELAGHLMLENDQINKGIFWYSKYLETSPSPSAMNFIYLATKMIEIKPRESFNLFTISAFKGSYLAIINIIDFYEKNIEMQDIVKARLWRKTLPLDWQECSMGDFLNYLEEQGYDFTSTEKLHIPAELLS